MLTSGGRATALEGVDTLARLVDRAAGRIAIMAGGRLDLENLETVIRQARVPEVHLGSAVTRIHQSATAIQPPDGSENSWTQTDMDRVATVVARVQGGRLARS